MTKYQFAVIGADKAASHLRTMERNMLSFQPAYDEIGMHFREQVSEQFGLRGVLPGVRGIPWMPLSPRTIYLRGGTSIQLQHMNRLRTSYISQASPFNISDSSSVIAKFGSFFKAKNNKGKIVPVAKFHQEGTKKMSARPVILGNKILDETIVEAFSERIFEGWA